MELLAATPESIHRAAEALRAGEIVAYPTETVYGLGVDPGNEDALRRLFLLKRRDDEKPVLLIASNREQVARLAGNLTDRAKACADTFWPGPLSMLLPAGDAMPQGVVGRDGRICVRETSCVIAWELCEAFGGAIVSTSANRSGAAPALRPVEVPGEGVTCCIDGGVLSKGEPSTVLDPETGSILRSGAIDADAVQRVLDTI